MRDTPPTRRSIAWLAVATLAFGSARADDPQPAAPAPASAATLADFGRWVIAADYTRDGGLLLTAGGESLLYRPGDVVVWKVADGSRVGDLAGHPTAVWSVKASADGKLAATAGYDGLVKVWDLPTRGLRHDLRKHRGWVRGVAFSPDGTRLATAGEDGAVILWDTASGAEVRSIAAHAGAATCVAFSPDGATLATGGSDKLVKLWNAADGAEKGRLEGHGDTLWAVAFSPDGGRLASAGADRTIRLWTVADSRAEATLAGHRDWVTSIAFTPDGARLASGCLDGAVKLWDVAAKGEQEGPELVKSSVWAVAFAADGKTLFVGTHAGGRLLTPPVPKLLPPPPSPPAPPMVAVLVPTEFTSAAGAVGAIAADGAVTVTGDRAKDTYTLTAAVPGGGMVKAIVLETLTDPSLPQQGPGRADNGNFVLSAFRASFGPAGAKETPTAVRFTAARATHEQGDFVAAGAIDEKVETGWGIFGGTGRPQSITFDVAPDTVPPAGGPLVVTMDQQYGDGRHQIGKFKLAVLQDPASATAPVAPAPPGPAAQPQQPTQ